MQSQNIPLGLAWDLIKHLKAVKIPGRESFLILKEYYRMYRRNEFVSLKSLMIYPLDQYNPKALK